MINIEKEVLLSLIEKYKLSKEEHDNILKELIDQLFSKKVKNEKPSIMFVIGQPGSGKTTFINSVNLSEYTIINSDEYRKLIKFYPEIMENYPTLLSKLTNYDAHLWGDELFSYGTINGYSVLREKVPVDYSLIDLIKELSSKHDITINVLVTGKLTSLLATRERYEKEVLENKNAKLSNIDAHNKCYDLLPQFIATCVELGVKVNYVVPFNNEFKIITPNDNYLDILEQLREESNMNAYETFESRIDRIKQFMANRNASNEEYDELDKIQKIYEEIKNKKEKNNDCKLEN